MATKQEKRTKAFNSVIVSTDTKPLKKARKAFVSSELGGIELTATQVKTFFGV